MVIEKDGIVVDGAGFALLGNGTIGELYLRISGTGISLAGRSDVTIKNLTIEEYLVGINVNSCSYVTVEGCAVSRNLQGIYASGDSPKLRISNNTIQANDLHGIWLSDINGSLISGNKVLDNSHFGGTAAIIVVSGSDNVIVGNFVETGGGGISMSRSMNNIVVGNTIANNYAAGPTFHVQSEGLYVSAYSEGNMIYLNNFVNNTVVLSDQVGSHNFWDNGTVGNYWSNYLERYPNATEIDGSGVCDTPYVLESVEGTDLRLLSVENTDHYPLLLPVSSAEAEALQVVLEHEWDLGQESSSSDLFIIAAVAIASAFVIFAIAVVLGTGGKGRRGSRRYY
jgi:parallel beta-helix repeat protein